MFQTTNQIGSITWSTAKLVKYRPSPIQITDFSLFPSRWSKGCGQFPLPGHEPKAFYGSLVGEMIIFYRIANGGSGMILDNYLQKICRTKLCGIHTFSHTHPLWKKVFNFKGIDAGQQGLSILICGRCFTIHNFFDQKWTYAQHYRIVFWREGGASTILILGSHF